MSQLWTMCNELEVLYFQNDSLTYLIVQGYRPTSFFSETRNVMSHIQLCLWTVVVHPRTWRLHSKWNSLHTCQDSQIDAEYTSFACVIGRRITAHKSIQYGVRRGFLCHTTLPVKSDVRSGTVENKTPTFQRNVTVPFFEHNMSSVRSNISSCCLSAQHVSAQPHIQHCPGNSDVHTRTWC